VPGGQDEESCKTHRYKEAARIKVCINWGKSRVRTLTADMEDCVVHRGRREETLRDRDAGRTMVGPLEVLLESKKKKDQRGGGDRGSTYPKGCAGRRCPRCCYKKFFQRSS